MGKATKMLEMFEEQPEVEIKHFDGSISKKRIEVELTNGQKFTLFVNPDGLVELISNNPSKIGAEMIANHGWKAPVNHYGHPYED